MTRPMRTLCAWCGDTMDAEPGEKGEGQPISHGLCSSCEHTLLAQLGTPVQQFLESLDAPVILVDVERGGRFVTANEPALTATGTDVNSARGRLMGEVFECLHAAEPSGCGRTVHCSGCAARNAVEHTWETGEPKVRVPATLLPQDGTPRVELLISTERVGDHVLLRIDRGPTPVTPPG